MLPDIQQIYSIEELLKWNPIDLTDEEKSAVELIKNHPASKLELTEVEWLEVIQNFKILYREKMND